MDDGTAEEAIGGQRRTAKESCGHARSRLVRRARVVLLSAAGKPNRDIAQLLDEQRDRGQVVPALTRSRGPR